LYLAERIKASGKDITLTCVDTWKGSSEHMGVDPDALFSEFIENTKGAAIDIEVGYSVEVAKGMADGSLDFVFIDAGHDYESVYADIAAWKPKLKPTGVMAGDDISEFEGVGRALKAHGYGFEAKPVILGGSAQPAWVIPPPGKEFEWITPKA